MNDHKKSVMSNFAMEVAVCVFLQRLSGEDFTTLLSDDSKARLECDSSACVSEEVK